MLNGDKLISVFSDAGFWFNLDLKFLLLFAFSAIF